jgi:hypothetical protein
VPAKRRRKVNKSQAIRDFLATNPSATATVIQEALARKGIQVDAALISQVKYTFSAGRPRPAFLPPADFRFAAFGLLLLDLGRMLLLQPSGKRGAGT